MRKLLLIFLVGITCTALAQSNDDAVTFERKGFVIGLGAGGGVLNLQTNDTVSTAFSPSLPNLKIGWMINSRLALVVLLPGAVYEYHGSSRGFEGIVAAAQYWVKDKWWVMGGIGLTFDAPAFYTVKDPSEAGFYTGFPALSVATGYEVWRKGHFALDLQYRFFSGKSELSAEVNRNGISNMLLVGFNWY